eukprot:gnl/Dysnectes_brevis/2879_a3517_1300.p1 GENE.gnl/Dysnectes_brevis/2879_a3517_1300~~gnl/Dysnectes_brevis/2879_a3517_1300.p1  ORF type:complete len:271 (+),score=30.80 gnl/Dysnectes_brevis/2879_a3517_1300:778-1590(+)
MNTQLVLAALSQYPDRRQWIRKWIGRNWGVYIVSRCLEQANVFKDEYRLLLETIPTPETLVACTHHLGQVSLKTCPVTGLPLTEYVVDHLKSFSSHPWLVWSPSNLFVMGKEINRIKNLATLDQSQLLSEVDPASITRTPLSQNTIVLLKKLFSTGRGQRTAFSLKDKRAVLDGVWPCWAGLGERRRVSPNMMTGAFALLQSRLAKMVCHGGSHLNYVDLLIALGQVPDVCPFFGTSMKYSSVSRSPTNPSSDRIIPGSDGGRYTSGNMN